jgi:antitoxin YefM
VAGNAWIAVKIGVACGEGAFMDAITLGQAKANLDELIRRVNQDVESAIICNDMGDKAVLLSLDEFNAWQETLYLLGNAENARHLLKSIQEAETGKVITQKLADA